MGYGAADGVRQKFTEYERDIETGLDYAQARYYGSAMGRFTSPDPMLASAVAFNPKTWNRYSYAFNNPLRFTDPSGLRAKCLDASCSGRDEDEWFRNEDDFGTDSDSSVDSQVRSRVEPESHDPELAQQDRDFAALFSDGEAVARGSDDLITRGEGYGGLSHFQTADGRVYTVHIYGNTEGTGSANLYVPRGFTPVYEGGKNNQVVAANKRTGEVIVFVHVKGVSSQKGLESVMRSHKPNVAGSRFIGQTGGKEGEDAGYVHSHITIYKTAQGRADIRRQSGPQGTGRITDTSGYGDLRRLIQRK